MTTNHRSHSALAEAWSRDMDVNHSIRGGGNMYSIKNKIYSFGDHYCIAHVLPNITLFNSDRYSSYTSKHRNHVFSEISHHNIVNIPNPELDSQQQHSTNLQWLVEQREMCKDKATRAWKHRDGWLKRAESYDQDITTYIEYFPQAIAARMKGGWNGN